MIYGRTVVGPTQKLRVTSQIVVIDVLKVARGGGWVQADTLDREPPQ
jgi:hypothetical protein